MNDIRCIEPKNFCHGEASLKQKYSLLFSLLVTTCFTTSEVLAHPLIRSSKEFSESALIIAEEMSYDEKKEMVIAKGNVEILQGERILIADKVIYYPRADRVIASGNVSLMEPSGDVLFSDTLEVSDNMKQGTITHFKARFSDNSLLAANSAKRLNNNVTILKDAVYSPCPLKSGKTKCRYIRDPQWQIKAKKVTIDDAEQRVTYKHAWFELYQVPILYTPYFSHATPNADSKTGFLTPSYGTIGSLGAMFKFPYFISITPAMDATITPIITTAEGPVLAGEFRHLTPNSFYEFEGSITNPNDYRINPLTGRTYPGHIWRGHVQGKGIYHLEENWVGGFNMKATSDDTYLRRYKFGQEDFLTSTVYLERLKNRDYFSAKAVNFQELTPFNRGEPPFIFPLIDHHIERKFNQYGSIWAWDNNALLLYRDREAEIGRYSTRLTWRQPYITDTGQVWQLSTSMRGDLYTIHHYDSLLQPNNPVSDSLETRIIPEIRLDWRYPLQNSFQSQQIYLEPIINLMLSPYGNNPVNIPNEDSQRVQLADTNLFDSDRFSGLDRVESGPRANYGMRASWILPTEQEVGILFGQTYHTREEKSLQQGSGVNESFSDYVGRIYLKPFKLLDIGYRFRLDNKNFSIQQNEVEALFTHPKFQLNLNYLSLNDFDPTLDPNRKEVYAAGRFHLSDSWAIHADGRRNLSKHGGMIAAGTGLTYHGPCTEIVTSLNRQFTRDRDIKPSTSLVVQFFLKNLR